MSRPREPEIEEDEAPIEPERSAKPKKAPMPIKPLTGKEREKRRKALLKAQKKGKRRRRRPAAVIGRFQ